MCFHQVLQSDPDSLPALRGLAESCYSLGDPDQAEKHSIQALRLSPDDIQTLNNLGVIFFSQSRYMESEQMLSRALAIDRSCADTRMNLLNLYGTLTLKTSPERQRDEIILQNIRWISENAPDGSRQSLLHENHRLRDTVLNEYRNCYKNTDSAILLHRPTNGAIKYLVDSWCEVLTFMGIRCDILNWDENTRLKLESFRPTTFITVRDPAYLGVLDNNSVAQYKRSHGLKVGHILAGQELDAACDFYITWHLDPSRDSRFENLDHPLVSLPFAINPLQHYMRPSNEMWDFFFVGTNSHLKTETTNDYLAPILDDFQGILAGANWPIGMGELSVSQAAQMYGFAKVCPNFHLPWQYDSFDELNERTYIIPACGGFELVDNPAAMREMFAFDEMAVARSPQEYHEMFRHFLNHPDERLPYVRKGMARVYSEYTLFHVLSRLAEFLEIKPQLSRQQPAES